MPSELLRTFIAIDLPAALLRALTATQHEVQEYLRGQGQDRALRWSPTQNLHLTLRFLGDTTAAQRSAVNTRLQLIAAATAPFRLQVDTGWQGLGGFPNLRQPRVLWTGVTGDVAALHQLQGAIEQSVQAAGFAPEEKSYSPHLTLARAARDAERRALAQAGQAIGDFARGTVASGAMASGAMASEAGASAPMHFTVDHVTMYQSDLGAGGSRYTPLVVFPLGAA